MENHEIREEIFASDSSGVESVSIIRSAKFNGPWCVQNTR